MNDLRSACAALAASDDAAWREQYARECTERLTANGPTLVRQATFGDMAEVVEVDPSGILWVLSAFDGRRYWTGPENLVTHELSAPPNGSSGRDPGAISRLPMLAAEQSDNSTTVERR